MSFQVPISVLPVEGAQLREQPGVGEKGNYISTLQVIQQNFPEEIRRGSYLGEEAEMAKVVDEVLKANKRYLAKFGDKGSCLCHRPVVSPSSPAWMQGALTLVPSMNGR
jgi:hypothetical protein